MDQIPETNVIQTEPSGETEKKLGRGQGGGLVLVSSEPIHRKCLKKSNLKLSN